MAWQNAGQQLEAKRQYTQYEKEAALENKSENWA